MPASEPLHKKHPELFHYTGWKGVEGILSSQTLWSTHYRFLNDTTEVQLMRAQLEMRLFPFMKNLFLEKFRRAGLREKNQMRKTGGVLKIAHQESTHLADTFFKTAFESSDKGEALAVPFIASFCAHTSDQEYERKNGLLSQWRAYGDGGGFAIVFDTKKLVSLCMKEADHYFYTSGIIGDVIYEGDEEAFTNEFGETIRNIEAGFLKFTESGSMEVGEIFGDVLSMFTRLKHRAFFEEREVRAVSFPMTPAIEKRYRDADPAYISSEKPLKKIHYRAGGVPYIELFDFEPRVNLPIVRIIVGPQKNQDDAVNFVKSLVEGKQISVSSSETPYQSR